MIGRSPEREDRARESSVGPSASPPSRIVLVGFMGAGKSTVGPLLAHRLGWSFYDLDLELERNWNVSLRETVLRRPKYFRKQEAAAAASLLRRARIVLATGGGWAAQPGNLESIRGRARSVWLRVDLERALERIRDQGTARPLLEGDGMAEKARRLLEERIPYYALSDYIVDTDGITPDDIARKIAGAMSAPAKMEAD